jgi:hypothetical protein
MLHLYRGLIDILNARAAALNEDFKQHIQTHREYRKRDIDNQINSHGVEGYWNLILEIVFLIYVKFVHITGIALIAALALIFFPLSAVIAVFENLVYRFDREHRQFVQAQQEHQKQILMESNNEQGK